jgi:hypothetical protein
MGAHLPISKFMELVGNEGQYPFSLHPGTVTPVPVVLTQLFQLVVQVSHGAAKPPKVTLFGVLSPHVVSVSDHRPTGVGKVCSVTADKDPGTPLPIRPERAFFKSHTGWSDGSDEKPSADQLDSHAEEPG